VHTAYKAQVPDKMSETEFWGAFFKSKYFHRDRKAGHEDLFTKYEEINGKEASHAKIDPRGIVDPLVDLTATNEDAPHHHHQSKPAGKQDPDSITIQKFNRHGAYVLDPVHAGKLQPQKQDVLKKNRPSYHDRIEDATELDDLKAKDPPSYCPLTLENESRYFQHAQSGPSEQRLGGNLQEAEKRFAKACATPFHLEKAFPSSQVSLNVISEILSCADSGADVSTLTGGATAVDIIPNEFKKQVYNQFHDVSELLRHFLSFKAKAARDPDAKHKLNKIIEKMGQKYDELVKIREALPPHEKNLLAPLLKPFDDQLNLAFI
jgi:transcription initiation factor TFIIH subunit 1